jgi:hypothetical protein
MRPKFASVSLAVAGALVLALMSATPAQAGSLQVQGVTISWDDAALAYPPDGGCVDLRINFVNSASDTEGILVMMGGIIFGSIRKPGATGTLVKNLCRPTLAWSGPTFEVMLHVDYALSGMIAHFAEVKGSMTWTDPYDPALVPQQPKVHQTYTVYTRCASNKGYLFQVVLGEQCPSGWHHSLAWMVRSLPGPPVIYSVKTQCVNIRSEKSGKPKYRVLVGILCPAGWRSTYLKKNPDYDIALGALRAAGQLG